ncbi:CAP domain-containing protein [Acrocarpospora sp. B8E8]|uniref:CAP domain-containing protein n=1 Tax=Acrocarpospora sp. B8E8 TaxID=3153572 RepID=UPI00325CDE87
MNKPLRALLCATAIFAVGCGTTPLPAASPVAASAGLAAKSTGSSGGSSSGASAASVAESSAAARCRVAAGKPSLTAGRLRASVSRAGCTREARLRIRIKKSVAGPDRVVKSGSRIVRNARLTATVKCASGVFYTTATDSAGHVATSRKVRVKCPAVPKPTPTPTPTEDPSGGTGSGVGTAIENEVVRLTNVERAKAGCRPLTHEARLHTAARGHSADMSAKNYFSHDSKDGRSFVDRIKATGYSFSSIGENIAQGQQTAASVIKDWMGSQGHRENILNCSYTQIGVGYVAAGGPYWTQDFGRP